jgi:Flp pilus assembly protein TadG
MRRLHGSRRRRPGQSLVEFALILPVLLLIFMGIVDFGRVIYAYNSVSNAAREGARIGIVDQRTGAGGAYLAAIEAANQATALGLDPRNPSQVLVTFPDPTPTHTCPIVSVGCPISVRVQYQFTAITPIIGRIIGPITVGSTAELPVERVQLTP